MSQFNRLFLSLTRITSIVIETTVQNSEDYLIKDIHQSHEAHQYQRDDHEELMSEKRSEDLLVMCHNDNTDCSAVSQRLQVSS